MSKNLNSLIVSDSFKRLIQLDPDNNNDIVDGTGSIVLISTSSIKNWSSAVSSSVAVLGFITQTGVVFTTKPNTGSINLKGNIVVDGGVYLKNGSEISENGNLSLSEFTGDKNYLSLGSLFYSGSDFFIVH